MRIIPPYLPAHEALNWISGAAEIVLGVSLLPKRTRRLASWGSIALLVAVFPANIYVYQNRQQTDRAVALGIFGAPTFVSRGEVFWGHDRLEQAVAWHASRG